MSHLIFITPQDNDNVVGFPLEFEHGAQVWPKKCTMQRPIKKSFLMLTTSERRSLNGDDHESNCHNNYENGAFAIGNVTKKY